MRHSNLCNSVFVVLFALCTLSSNSIAANEKSVLGWVENVVIEPWGFKVKAKLDTGANTASLHAKDIERFEKDDDEWVRFLLELEVENEEGEEELQRVEVERPLERNILIKRHRTESRRRPVVEMSFCLNGEIHEAEFSLTDRGKFIYPVLFGRRFLQDVAVVDPGDTFLYTKKCKVEKSEANKDDDGKEADDDTEDES